MFLCIQLAAHQESIRPGPHHAQSIDETLKNSKEAIEAHLQALKDDQVTAPIEESLFIGRVQVEVTMISAGPDKKGTSEPIQFPQPLRPSHQLAAHQ